MAGEATYLLQDTYTASRLDEGMIGVLEAGGSAEFGYSYTYALKGAPAGITVDEQSGAVLSDGKAASGAYTFDAVVTNVKDTSKVATLPVTLTLLPDADDDEPGSSPGYRYDWTINAANVNVVTSLSVDAAAGSLTEAQMKTPGTYPFSATARVTAGAATVPVSGTLTVSIVTAVAAKPSDPVTRKIYAVNSGAYGLPSGSDYTAVLFAIRAQIIADQKAVPDERFRAVVEFDPAVPVYGCTDNRWTYGVQFLEMRSAMPGTRFNYKNIRAPGTTANMSASVLQIGRGFMTNCQPTGSFVGDANKANSYRIATAQKGEMQVTLQSAADAAAIMPFIGRYIMIGSYDQQGEGFPANLRYFDYARVKSVSGTTVNLDRRLRYTHKANLWENPATDNSMGPAQIKIIDRDDQRLTLRARVVDCNFMENTALPRQDLYVYAFDAEFVNCDIRRYIPSQCRYHRFVNCSVDSAEFDKMICMVAMKGVACDASFGGMCQGTGMEFLLYDRCNIVSGYGCVPRQWRIVGGEQRGANDYPLTFSSLSQIRQVIAKGVSFKGKAPVVSKWPNEKITVGVYGVAWDRAAGVLTVPVKDPLGSAAYNVARRFMAQTHEGSIVHAGGETSSRYGEVTGITGDASGHRLEIRWLDGAQPAAGDVLEAPKLHELTMDSACTATAGTAFNDAGASQQRVPGVASRDFPSGYDARRWGF